MMIMINNLPLKRFKYFQMIRNQFKHIVVGFFLFKKSKNHRCTKVNKRRKDVEKYLVDTKKP